MNSWYKTLQRPPLTPPDWVFGPVWSVLYLMIGSAVVLWWRTHQTRPSAGDLALLGVHLTSNAIWSFLFFGLRSPGKALLDILVLVSTLVVLIGRFWKISRAAGALLIPYLLWVLFATYLNVGFLWLNQAPSH
jgi:translocator protein